MDLLAPLLVGVALASVWHVKALGREYAAYTPVRHAIDQNFESGFSAGDYEITYEVPPSRGVLAFAEIKPGTIIYELGGVPEEMARAALRLCAHKIPFRTKFVKREVAA